MNSSREKAILLLSAGLDSVFNLYKARQQFDIVMTLTFDYGQKAASKERAAAERIAVKIGVPHQVISLPWFSSFSQGLVGGEIPLGSEVEIDNLEQSSKTAARVWVPNRNGIFMNIAAGFAEGLGAQWVIAGFNYEEAQTFPDNSVAFMKTLDEAWRFSTQGKVRTYCFSHHLNKTQIVAEGKALGLPFADLWPCYQSLPKWCGECESCQRFRRALEANRISFEQLRG